MRVERVSPVVDPTTGAAQVTLRLPSAAGARASGFDKARLTTDRKQDGLAVPKLALACVFFVMASLFESLTLPLVVMACVPFASLGVFWTLMATGTPLNLMALLGIVVNNGIVLVDRIGRRRRGGLPPDEALLRGTHLSGLEYDPLAKAICGGLAAGTALTLLVLLAYYALAVRWVERMRSASETAAVIPANVSRA